jgi:penicillin-binding protein 2
MIYDRMSRVLAENVPRYQLRIDPEVASELGSSLAFAAAVASPEPGEMVRRWQDRSAANLRRYPLVEDLTLQQVARIEMAALEHPEFGIEVDHRRLIRHGPLTTHVMGYLGQATAQDLQGARSALVLGDLIGRQGIEKRYDDWLRGEKGDRVVMVDSRGRVVEEYHREAAVPGGSLTLTLDLELQRVAAESLGSQVGAVVVLDPSNGEILAMASSPAYDGNMFSIGCIPRNGSPW